MSLTGYEYHKTPYTVFPCDAAECELAKNDKNNKLKQIAILHRDQFELNSLKTLQP